MYPCGLINSSPDSHVVREVAIGSSLSLTTARVRIPARACEKVASDLGLGVGFHWVLLFRSLLITAKSRQPQYGRKCDEKWEFPYSWCTCHTYIMDVSQEILPPQPNQVLRCVFEGINKSSITASRKLPCMPISSEPFQLCPRDVWTSRKHLTQIGRQS